MPSRFGAKPEQVAFIHLSIQKQQGFNDCFYSAFIIQVFLHYKKLQKKKPLHISTHAQQNGK